MDMSFIIILICCLTLIACQEEKFENNCFHGLLLNSCKCENISPYYSTEKRLDCSGRDAAKTAHEIFEFSDDKHSIVEIKISSSSLQHLSTDNLNPSLLVPRLFLSNNNIYSIDPLLFENSVNVVVLDISFNHLTSFKPFTFKFFEKLQNLSLAHNEIGILQFDVFHNMIELRYLDMSYNKLTLLDSKWFNNCRKLQYLSLSNNDLAYIETNAFQNLASLQSLDLSENKLSLLPAYIFAPLNSLKNISIAMNNFKNFENNTFQANKVLERANLTGNPWVCDKTMISHHEWLKKHEVDKAYCASPPEFNNSSLQISLYVLYLEVKLDESPICNASMCNCTVSKDKYVVTVDCVGRGFTKLPESLPYKTRALDLRNNNIQSLNTDHVNVTQWADVAFLHLNNNRIDSLKGLEGSWLLHNLVALHLYKNKLTEIPIHILEQFRGGLLDELYLSGNPWNCGCNTVRFQMWLQDHYKSIKDFDLIRCSPDSGNFSNQPIVRLRKSQLCPQQSQLINYLDVLNGLMAIVIVLIILKLSFDYWLQKRTGKLPRFFSINIY